ncbi:hypothetical protein FPSE_09747 [Fusarium pseudograminearum CS3096]|uniref:Major facilitator superfamily (MFS) profile domain-containing protein n=1 Tax=Fusarium pseudograminearum (strain CS3096) TaxID=1028729 RepID=K3V8T6_FUSPC|nr:hypothetical protein FPSE_09747 [Fusarium pseudograminearum CS3096]EKJ70087.1 hypothetical protein FPSE_09747 [Fusarium pseudograminearum CS3096]
MAANFTAFLTLPQARFLSPLPDLTLALLQEFGSPEIWEHYMNSVATSLPTISEALDAGPTVTWVGTSYLLGQLSFQPLYGRISDITSRKPVLLFSMGCIVIDGILCGFARTPVWLYVCRTISGIGGGGISSSVAIIVSDLVSLRSRGKYQGFISLAIGTGATSGPFVAAGLIQMTTDGWRWAFWVPAIMGTMSINSGGSMWAWKNVKTISMLTIGIIMILVFIIIEAFFAKIPIIPLRLFKQRSPSVLILTGFLHDFAWQSTQYFVPLYYQTVCGFTPLRSATLIVPFLLAQGIAGAASGPLMARYARYMPILRAGFTVWTVGAGLKLLFHQDTHIAVYIVVLAVEVAGIGWVHQPGLVALQANSADEDRAVATGTRNVFRSLGGVVGIAVSTAVYYAVLDKALQTDNTIPDSLRGSVLDGTWSVEDPKTEHFLVDDIILKGDVDQSERCDNQGVAISTESARDVKRG